MVGLTILVLAALMALLAPLLANEDALRAVNAVDNPTWSPPSREFLLGTDNLGRSVGVQFVYGARISLFVGLLATILTMLIGTSVGVAAGFFGGWTESVLMRFTDWFLVIPFLPLAIVLARILGPSVWNIIFVIGVTSWPYVARLVRAQVLTVKQRLYVERARALGASRWHVVRRHILPNTGPVILANTTLTVPIVILTETTLAFLGLGDPTRSSWGKTLEEAVQGGRDHPQRLVVLPSRRHRDRARRARRSRCAVAPSRRSSTPGCGTNADVLGARAARPRRDVSQP